MIRIPPLKATVPAPLILELAARVPVPPLKASVASATEAVKLPLLLLAPARLSVPLRASTLPLLLRAMVRVVVPLPCDLRKVPLLLNNDASPPWLSKMPLSLCASQVPLLLMAAATPVYTLPPLQVIRPALFRVRCVRTLSLPPLIDRQSTRRNPRDGLTSNV